MSKLEIIALSRYVFASTLQILSRRLPSYETPDDDSGTKRLRSSNLNFQKHCLFCLDITKCILPNECDPKVLQQCRIPASKVTTDKIADGQTT